MTIDQPLSEAAMRQAVATRDTSFDGVFVYAVVTTGVFCRPSCAARRARPENLRFFPTVMAARTAGFRPCKRCAPDDPGQEAGRIVDIARFIADNAGETLTLTTLGQHFGLSPAHLQKRFKAAVGVSPKAYQDAVRVRTVKSLLKAGDDVTGAIFEAGYGSTSRFYDRALPYMGMTPATYRSGGRGETIGYGCRDSVLGPLMMAASARGICFVMFGDSKAALIGDLAAEFPHAQRVEMPDDHRAHLDAWMSALESYLSGLSVRPDLPLDLRGTAFQRLTWAFLLTIPEGRTVRYAEVAEGMGRPKAIRAAASACARNRIAVLVPCHRVLRGDGGIGGYRWGVDRKRALLDKERDGSVP
jgi:AraC family transcriptional regulator of adaptative response/methylated-DNA-[protein]-cysteine methyltransferase